MKPSRFFVCFFAVCAGISCLFPSAFAQTFADAAVTAPKNGMSMAIILFTVLALCFAAMAFVVKQGRTGHSNVPWAVLATVLAGTAMAVAVIGYNAGTVYTRPDGDPKETVIDFFNSVKTGDYPTAYGCLTDYSGLGLENVPETAEGRMIYDALKLSFDYTVMGSATVNKLSAFVPVRVKYLDISELGQAVPALVNKNLEKIVESSPRNLVYGSDDKYLPEVTDKAYAQAVEKLIDRPETYYTSEQINVELEYDNGVWYIVTDARLLNALSGGTLQSHIGG